RDPGHLAGEGVELVHHGVDRLFELEDLAADVDGDLPRQIAAGDRGGHFGDVSHLRGEVAGHEVDVVGQVLPGAGDAAVPPLAAQLSRGAAVPRDAGHLGGEGVELIHHGVDGVLELEDFTPDVDGDLSRQVSARDRGGHLGDVSHLVGEVAAHRVHRVGQVLPGTGDAGHDRLTAEFSFRTHLAGDAGHFGGEGAKLFHHAVDPFLQ